MKQRTFDEWFVDFVRYNKGGNVERKFVTPEGHRLGSWVNCIRSGNIKVMEEQKKRLTESGFIWKVKSSHRKFEEWFADFMRYNEGGHVSTSYVTPEGYALGNWVSNVRKGSIKLTEEQKNRLTEAGFKWKIERGRSSAMKEI